MKYIEKTSIIQNIRVIYILQLMQHCIIILEDRQESTSVVKTLIDDYNDIFTMTENIQYV
mgnify:CR=1 FL=1